MSSFLGAFCLPTTGQLLNHFVNRKHKIYELEPFIKPESFLSDERDRGLKIHKRAMQHNFRLFSLFFPHLLHINRTIKAMPVGVSKEGD